MSYQNPAFMIDHPAQALAVTAIADINADPLSTADKRAFYDGRQGTIGIFTPDALDGGVQYDFGSDVAYNRCVIPSDHDGLAGENVRLTSSANSSHSPFLIEGYPGYPGAADPVVTGEPIDFGVDTSAPERYWAFVVNSAIGVDCEVSEIWLGTRNELTTSVAVQPEFVDEWAHELAEQTFGGGESTLELSPSRRVFELSVRRVEEGTADFTTLAEIMQLGRTQPFWYWPPDDQAGGPFLVKLSRSASRRMDFEMPSVAMKYRVDLQMIEQLG
jgi:hypothetical protein|tara:strand:- start:39 stop:857 length:819 start_codon:yes stop_codon:yes gene_type:complete